MANRSIYIRDLNTGALVPIAYTDNGDGTYSERFAVTSGSLSFGAGDAQNIYFATTSQYLSIKNGTAGNPDTALGPLLKVERIINVAENVIGGDGGEQLAAILGVSVGTAACQTQPVGIFGGAKTASTDAGSVAGGNDAVGVYGVGIALSGATGVGFGGFFQGRRNSSAGYASAVELLCSNFTTISGTYNPTGFSSLAGITLNCNGNADCGVAIQIRPVGVQWNTGIGFVKENGISSVAITSIRDDSDSATSLAINGVHVIASIAVAPNAGPVLIGGNSALVSGALLEVQGPDAASNPMVVFGSLAYNRPYSVRLRNSSAQHLWFITSTTNQFLTGTVAGDSGFSAVDSGKSIHLGGSTSVVQVKQDNTLGFFQTAPVAKQASGANLTNSVTAGGVNDTITDWTNLATYSTDAAAIRNAVYQLARKLKQVNDALRLYGLLT